MLIMKFIEITVFCPRLYSFGVLRTWQDDQLFNVYPPERLLKLEQKLLKPCLETFRPNTNGVFAPILSFRMVRIFERKSCFKRDVPWYHIFGRIMESWCKLQHRQLIRCVYSCGHSLLANFPFPTFGAVCTTIFLQQTRQYILVLSMTIFLDFSILYLNIVYWMPSRSLICAWRQKAWRCRLISRYEPTWSCSAHHPCWPFFQAVPYTVRAIDPSDIIDIVAASLRSHLFMALNKVWKQFRGAGIGAHILPSLSNLAVTIVEKTWQYMFQEAINAPALAFLGVRYVDNRFILFSEFKHVLPMPSSFGSSIFLWTPCRAWTGWNWWILGICRPSQPDNQLQAPWTMANSWCILRWQSQSSAQWTLVQSPFDQTLHLSLYSSVCQDRRAHSPLST